MKKITTLICLTLLTSIYAQNENLILKNSSFKSEYNGWSKKILSDGSSNVKTEASFSLYLNGQDDDSAAKVRVIRLPKANNNADYNVSLLAKLKPLKKNKQYELTFWVKSRVADDKINVLLLSSKETGSEGNYSLIKWKELKLAGNNSWEKFTIKFNATTSNKEKLDVKNVAVKFGFGDRLGTTYIDNVRVVRIDK